VINPGHIKSWTRTNSRSVLDTFLFGDRPQFEHEFDDRQNSEDLWRNLGICGQARICAGILSNTADSTIRPAQPATGNLGQARS
jgi:hypothetical protein